MRSRRKRTVSKRIDFQQLEDRKMLAATSGLQVANDLPPTTNLIVNGDFESFTRTGSRTFEGATATAGFFGNGLVDGFSVSDGDGDGAQQINLLTFDNDRGTVLDLDSLPGQDDRVFQDIATEDGQQYILSFDYLSPVLVDASVDPGTSDFEVFFDGELIAELSGNQFWLRASFVVTGGSGPTSRLEFRDASGTGDGRGALIDFVRLSAVSEGTVVNGDFEDTGADTSGPDFAPDDVAGFSVFNLSTDTQDRAIRIQDGGTEDSTGNALTLNSSSTEIDQVFQDLATTAGATYYVTFDLRLDPDSSGDPDQLRVRWNNQWAATLVGTDRWQTYGILVDADSDLTRLNFREAGEDSGDGAGPQIDNVRIFQVTPVVNDLIVDADGPASDTDAAIAFSAGDPPVAVASDLIIGHASGSQIDSATVAFQNGQASATELLAVNTGATGITSQFDATSGQLTLTGAATIADYQNVLRTLTYVNSDSNAPTATRTIAITIADTAILDANNSSQPALLTVNVEGENNAPLLETIAPIQAGFGESVNLNVVPSSASSAITSFSATIDGVAPGNNTPTISDDGQFEFIPSVAGTFDVTVTATDASGATVQQTFPITVDPFIPFQGTGALSNIPPNLRSNIFTDPPPFNIDTNNTFEAVIDTDRGEIRILLEDDISPTFVNNFVNLARDGFYDGLVFHRVIDGFVAQGGDPLGTGTGGPGFQIPDEVGNTTPFNSRGQLSFANSGNNTTGSQFFITFGPTNLSTGQFTVFGNVTDGDEVLDQIVRTQVGNNTPIPGAVPDVINSITIIETPPASAPTTS